MRLCGLLIALITVVPGATPRVTDSVVPETVLPAIQMPIEFTMAEADVVTTAPEQNGVNYPPLQQQGGYYQPPQQQRGGYGSVHVTIPPGATGEQVFQMAGNANANGQRAEALAYLEKSAEMGYPKGEWSIGIDYLKGIGERQNLQQALHWLSLSADAGFRAGQYQMGDMYERGDGVPRDQARAIQLYKLAAAQHSADAEFALGLDYEFGTGVAHNRELATQYFRESSRDGTNTIGTDMANALVKAPATMRFSSLDDIGAFLHPPHKLKPGECPYFQTVTSGPYAQAQISLFCNANPGCPETSAGYSGLRCPG
jgi:Sel1 repeat